MNLKSQLCLYLETVEVFNKGVFVNKLLMYAEFKKIKLFVNNDDAIGKIQELGSLATHELHTKTWK